MNNNAGQSNEGSESSSTDEESQSEPELMITTRERRKTAGNRYSAVVAQEQEDEDAEDDVALLFAEMAEGEDEEYNSDESDDEADMSSSDDDDQGPNVAADDMQGELELAKQDKVERQKKRKADMAMTTMHSIRKKPRIDPTTLHRAPESVKPSKRKERQSWIPDENAASGRTSLRKQTVAHRAVLYERLKETEEQRLKNKALREEKEKKKQADAPKELTQADRLAEAEKIERRNARSLNRWETVEKQKAAEQAAKLAALKERTLKGAVISFHSVQHVYLGPKVELLANGSGTEERVPKKRGPKPKESVYQSSPLVPSKSGFLPVTIVENNAKLLPGAISGLPPPASVLRPPELKPGTHDWLAGIHEYASMPSASGTATPVNAHSVADSVVPAEQKASTSATADPDPNSPCLINVDFQPVIVKTEGRNTDGSATPDLEPPQPQPGLQMQTMKYLPSVLPIPAYLPPHIAPATQVPKQPPFITMTQPQHNIHPYQPRIPLSLQTASPAPSSLTHVLDFTASSTTTTSQSPVTTPTVTQPVIEVTSTRNTLRLQGFEDLTADAKQALSVLHLPKKAPKPMKHVTELCTITGLPAKYRDPNTGVAYANSAAYKKLQLLQSHGYSWSSMLGCYVGRSGLAARGVPDGFLVGSNEKIPS